MQNDDDKSSSVSEARKGLTALMMSKFSSTPLQEMEYTVYDELKLRKRLAEDRDDLQHDAALTKAERQYLSALLESGDLESLESASAVLRDANVFPDHSECQQEEDSDDTTSERSRDESPPRMVGQDDPDATPRRANIQRELFRLHEKERMHPSAVVQRLNFVHKNSILSQASSEFCAHNNSSFLATSEDELRQQPSQVMDETTTTIDTDDGIMLDHSHTTPLNAWNPFEDVSSWLDGGQGVEVSDEGVVDSGSNDAHNPTQQQLPFRILGTTADDVSCHPHVLSPPLMESLLAFCPEYTDQSLNLWLKYSLVRDGSGIWAFLRQVRASTSCILAIETTEGHVFGAFTTQPWRLSKGWYGGSEAFLWQLRQPRHSGTSIVEQINHESEIQVFPCRQGNAAIQCCTKKAIMMGQGEVFESPTFHDPNKPKTGKTGKHYGYALSLDKEMKKGTTSSSETFGNPCLVDSTLRGARFTVSNIEVWTVTPHTTVQAAEQTELSNLFLDGGREEQRLNFMNILVGGPI